MTATCTPGLPRVVRFFVSSISLPALGPVSSCRAASGWPSAGLAAAAGAGAGRLGAGVAAAAAGIGGGAAGLGAAGAAGAAAGAAGLGAADGRGGERITIVFSKSSAAAGAAATAAASITYFILYLPISMTSLFWRMCFLIWLPLTIVPLVLPRSSRNESLRMVTMQACSPL